MINVKLVSDNIQNIKLKIFSLLSSFSKLFKNEPNKSPNKTNIFQLAIII